MKNVIFTGAGVAIVTPMSPDGSVNYNQLNELIDFQIQNGTDAIIACGTTGEASTLTDEEHVEVIRQSIISAKGRVPVIAGTGSNDTAYAIELSKEAEKLGSDALLVVTPYYNKTSQAGLIRHFTAIAESVSIPVILYNVPSRTGVDIKPETYYALSKVENIVATKEANGNIGALAKTISLCKDDLAVYSGNDDQITAFIALGAKGVISVLSNILPKITHDMAELALEGKVFESAKLQTEYIDLIDSLFCDVNPIPVKDALNIMGFDVGTVRMPLVPLSPANLERLKGSMRAKGLI